MKSDRVDLRDLKRRLQDAMRDVRDRTEKSGVNVGVRVNKAVVMNVGEKGGRRSATSRQRVRIKQDSGGTIEEVETREG